MRLQRSRELAGHKATTYKQTSRVVSSLRRTRTRQVLNHARGRSQKCPEALALEGLCFECHLNVGLLHVRDPNSQVGIWPCPRAWMSRPVIIVTRYLFLVRATVPHWLTPLVLSFSPSRKSAIRSAGDRLQLQRIWSEFWNQPAPWFDRNDCLVWTAEADMVPVSSTGWGYLLSGGSSRQGTQNLRAIWAGPGTGRETEFLYEQQAAAETSALITTSVFLIEERPQLSLCCFDY